MTLIYHIRQHIERPAGHLKPMLLLVGFWLGMVIISSPADAQKLSFNRVMPPAGKTFLHITGMVQDKRGFMWLASKNGLFRYDGYQMIHYKNNPLDPNSLAIAELECIAMDSSGIIWIGTFGAGLERLDPETGIFTHFTRNPNNPNSLLFDSVVAIMCDKEGMLWIGSIGLTRLDPKTNTFTHFRNDINDPGSLSSDEVRAIYEDKQGSLWIGTGSVYGANNVRPNYGGLNRMDKKKGRFTRFMHDPANPSSIANNKVRALFEDSKGNFWVGTAGDGLHTLNRRTGEFTHYYYDPKHPEKLSRPPLNKKVEFDHITFIREDVTGALWIGTAESGLNYYNPRTNRVTYYVSGKDTTGSFRDQTAWWAYPSREGVMWISTLHGNLYNINPVQGQIPFTTVQTEGVTSIYEHTDGSLWIGTRRDGLIIKDQSGNVIEKLKHDPANPESISSNDVSLIEGDAAGNIWVGTFEGGLNLWDKQKHIFTHYRHDPRQENSISNNTPLGLYDNGDDLWICTFRGLNRMNKKTATFRHYLFHAEDNPEQGSNITTSVLKDSKARWWAGTWMHGGVVRFDPEKGKIKNYLKGASILNIFEDHAHTLWVSGSEGIYRHNDQLDSFIRFEDPIFLSEIMEVRDFMEDNSGNLWVTSAEGIIRINKLRNETTLFGKNYGINGNELFYLSSNKGRNGKLYFGYLSGYYSFFPEQLAKGMHPPEITLSGFRISNKLITPGNNSPLSEPLSTIKEIRLNHNQNIFSFEFVGIDFSNPDENHHLFMLEGYDDNWNLASYERKAIYFNVPPGKYVFRVKVVNSYGIWSEKNINIIISPPWWTTLWFRIGALVLAALILYTIIRWRVRQKFQRQLEQSEKEKQLAELRRKTGDLEMQALRAQMNPHFVFNSLNAINSFILQKDKTQASEYLTKFSRLVRMILQNSQSSLITLESELESLRLYLELEALRFEHRFEYKINISKDVDADMIKVPPLIIQPYAENAIWHGLMHKEENGHLVIDITEELEYLQIRIMDDGIGRERSATMTSKTATKHKSMGLKITADRIAMLERTAMQKSSVVINDLVHPDGTAAGTEVIIKIPVIYDKGDIGG